MADMYVVPGQGGRTFVVTGANSGTGREAARRLAAAGARVVLGVRTPAKGEEARTAILAESPGADVLVRRLDLADLRSVREFADGLLADGTPVGALLNNAAVMAPTRRVASADGFELQFATNFLGHFALTLRLLPALLAGPAPRVVTVSSKMAGVGRIRFDDPQWERRYRPNRAYAQSKLAELMFALHLAGIAAERGWPLVSNAAHPGYTRTNLQKSGAVLTGRSTLMAVLADLPIAPAQHVSVGAEPMLYAATSPDAGNGGYYGPSGRLGLTGPPATARVPRRARDTAVAARLWADAERLTSVALPPR